MLDYMVVRGKNAGPLFRFGNGKPLTQRCLLLAVKDMLDEAGVYSDQYHGHSFYIGVATTTAARGLEYSLSR